MLAKIIWAIRAIFYKLTFKKYGFYSYIGKPAFICGRSNIVIGSKVRIFPGIRLECHQEGTITIQDDVSIAQNVHITAGFADLSIGSGTVILANSCITNITHSINDLSVPPSVRPMTYGKTTIGRNCMIGFGAVVLAGVELGDYCVVGANSVVRDSFPDYSVIAGVPAKIVIKSNFESKQWEKC